MKRLLSALLLGLLVAAQASGAMVYRTDGAWGSGKGTALTHVELDTNLWTLYQGRLIGRVLQIQTGAKVGGVAGWSVGDASDRGGLAKLPAGLTSSTLVVPLPDLKVGSVVTGYTVRGQIESAGGAVTLDAALRKITVAAADLTDAAVTSGAIVQVAVTADTSVAAAVTGLSETVIAGTTYYLLLTGTTAAATDIDLASVDVNITP